MFFDVEAGRVGEHHADFFYRDLRDRAGQGVAIRQAERGQGARPGCAVRQQSLAVLVGEECRFGGGAEIAVDFSGEKAERGEPSLQLFDFVAVGAGAQGGHEGSLWGGWGVGLPAKYSCAARYSLSMISAAGWPVPSLTGRLSSSFSAMICPRWR